MIKSWWRRVFGGKSEAPAPLEWNEEKETLREFHQRVYALYAEDVKAPAVKMLKQTLPEFTKAEIRSAIEADPEHWASPYHFFWGMAIRNLLRQEGFGEDYWPIWNLDDIYVMLIEDAVR